MKREILNNYKKFDFIAAYEMAIQDHNIIFIAEGTKDRYRVQTNNKIEFYSCTLDSWRKCPFLACSEIEGNWYIEKGGKIIEDDQKTL